MADPDNRPLKLCKSLNSAASNQQWGYQMVDETTVLERKKIPLVVYSTENSNSRWGFIVNVYDFNSLSMTSYMQSAYDEKSPASTPGIFQTHFSQIEGKQAIRDAHRALTLLGGKPEPLDDIMGYVMELKKDIPVSSPIRLKQQPG